MCYPVSPSETLRYVHASIHFLLPNMLFTLAFSISCPNKCYMVCRPTHSCWSHWPTPQLGLLQMSGNECGGVRAITNQSPLPPSRPCSLTGDTSNPCSYRLKLQGSDQWHFISATSRDRVCCVDWCPLAACWTPPHVHVDRDCVWLLRFHWLHSEGYYQEGW